MAVGLPLKTTYANGDVYSASDVNDTNGTVNLFTSAQYAAGKNDIINGAFDIWQRGTSFTTPASGSYTADRWVVNYNGSGSTRTISRQTFTPGTAPVSGYESAFFFRYAQSVAGTGGTFSNFATRLEDVRLLAGQTATLSYWAKADATRAVTANIEQNFGSGGSSPVYTTGTSVNLTTSWVRYTQTFTVPSISGKTIGTSSFISPYFDIPLNSTFTIDVWGVQLEASPTASAFQTATATVGGELALCQRYYQEYGSNGYNYISTAAASGGNINTTIYFPVRMRISPSISHNLTNANYASAWGLDVAYVAGNLAKTGTVTVNTAPTDNSMIFAFTGATWAQTPNNFSLYAGIGNAKLNAEL